MLAAGPLGRCPKYAVLKIWLALLAAEQCTP